MTDLEMKNEAEAEVEEFSDELSDEALDREQGEIKISSIAGMSLPTRH
jgi:hypothetical protein